MTDRLIAVMGFDASATGEEVQKIIYALTQTGYGLTIIKQSGEWRPEWSGWQIKITEDNEGERKP